MKKETDAEILARHLPPHPPVNQPIDPTCVEMHENGYCICLSVGCVFCNRYHPPHKACPKDRKGKK